MGNPENAEHGGQAEGDQHIDAADRQTIDRLLEDFDQHRPARVFSSAC